MSCFKAVCIFVCVYVYMRVHTKANLDQLPTILTANTVSHQAHPCCPLVGPLNCAVCPRVIVYRGVLPFPLSFTNRTLPLLSQQCAFCIHSFCGLRIGALEFLPLGSCVL